jgi:serine/threonine protein kinase
MRMSLTPGTRFGTYEVVQSLGSGGMGEVYRARDAKLRREVALKVLPAHHRLDADRQARFAREGLSLAALNHPNIATVHGVEDVDGVQALVMELVDGQAQCRSSKIRRSGWLAAARWMNSPTPWSMYRRSCSGVSSGEGGMSSYR